MIKCCLLLIALSINVFAFGGYEKVHKGEEDRLSRLYYDALVLRKSACNEGTDESCKEATLLLKLAAMKKNAFMKDKILSEL